MVGDERSINGLGSLTGPPLMDLLYMLCYRHLSTVPGGDTSLRRVNNMRGGSSTPEFASKATTACGCA